jgi:hypothetical protein
MTDAHELSIPKFLSRTRGKTREQIDAARKRAIAAAGEPATRKTIPTVPPVDRLTDRDREVIAEIQQGRQRKAEQGFKNRTTRVAREGRYVPGSYWDMRHGRWVHPALADKKAPPQTNHQPGETDMAKTKAKKKEANGGGRRIGQPAGKVGNFVPVRAGTARAKIVALGAKGDLTVAAIAARIGKDRKTVLTHLFCLNRDSAIGYRVKDDRVELSFPGSKTAKDAIKVAAEAA